MHAAAVAGFAADVRKGRKKLTDMDLFPEIETACKAAVRHREEAEFLKKLMDAERRKASADEVVAKFAPLPGATPQDAAESKGKPLVGLAAEAPLALPAAEAKAETVPQVREMAV